MLVMLIITSILIFGVLALFFYKFILNTQSAITAFKPYRKYNKNAVHNFDRTEISI
jgi:hypothetical protein